MKNKAITKIISMLVVVTMFISVFTFSASAATAVATVDLEAEKTNTSPDVYKITVSLTCSKTVDTVDLRMYYPKDVLTLIGKTGTPNSSGSNTAYNKLGDFADTAEHDIEMNEDAGVNDTIILGAGSGSFTVNRAPNTNQYGTLDTNTYGCLLFNWTANFDALAYLYSAKTKTAMFSFYMQVSDTAVDGDYEIGQFTGGQAWIINCSSDDAIGSMYTGAAEKSILTINNAKITVGSGVTSGPAVVKEKAQAKFDGTSVATPGNMTMRVISKITDADWDAYFSNTATGVTTGNNRIESVGMVAYMGAAFDLATAKDVVKGTATNADYKVGTTTYISKASDTADATFGTLMMLGSEQPTSDITYVGFVKYIDSTGATAYAFYDAQQVASVSSNYNTIVNGYPFA